MRYLALLFFIAGFDSAFAQGARGLNIGQTLKIEYGKSPGDEISFRREKDYYELNFVDRRLAKPTKNQKRAVLPSIAEKRISQLQQLITRHEKVIKAPESMSCTTYLKITVSKDTKTYCLDFLSKNADREFLLWIRSVTGLFSF